MWADHLLRRTGVTLATGVVGVAAVDGAKRMLRAGAVRRGAVVVTGWGLRGIRSAETGAEATRLAAADVVAEARERIGEQTAAPGSATGSDGHEH